MTATVAYESAPIVRPQTQVKKYKFDSSTKASSGYNTRTDLLPSQMAHAVVSSHLNTKYIQPHYPLADNVVSHAVPFAVLMEIKERFSKYGRFVPILQTKYHDLDRVFVVSETSSSKLKEYRIMYRNDHQVLRYPSGSQTTIEYIGENRFKLDVETFPIKQRYHHERQSVVHVLDTPHFRIELEVLLIGLDTYIGRKPVLCLDPTILVNPEVLGSHSFQFIVKDGIVRDELIEHIETLQSLNFGLFNL